MRALAVIAGGTAAAIALVAIAWYWADRQAGETDDE